MFGFSIPYFIRILSSAVWLAMSCAVYAQTYEESVAEYEKLDFASALVGFKKLATQDHKESQYYLGLMYSSGFGVPVDEEMAYEWFLKAAKQGYAEAQFRVALDLDVGHKKVPAADAKKAAFWYLKAAEQGHTESQWLLAALYDQGRGVTKDAQKAFEWNLKAAEKGTPDMQAEIAKNTCLELVLKRIPS